MVSPAAGSVRARVINDPQSGRQAIELPQGLRFEGDEILLRREADGAVTILDAALAWDRFTAALGCADADFLSDRGEPDKSEDRGAWWV